ncbi:hypothetical protein [Bacteroides heparinolyticus]|uniref:hypothetical protein n=1 Tax=Prevotella heparinolytica TaxID=28113 RepID=UPI0035A15E4D
MEMLVVAEGAEVCDIFWGVKLCEARCPWLSMMSRWLRAFLLYEDISLQKKRRSLQGYDRQILFCRYNIDKAIYDEGNDSMNIAVCDDEEKVREQIVSLIKKQSSDVNISSFAKGQ